MEINESKKCLKTLERVKGIEPSYSAWKSPNLPNVFKACSDKSDHTGRLRPLQNFPQSECPPVIAIITTIHSSNLWRWLDNRCPIAQCSFNSSLPLINGHQPGFHQLTESESTTAADHFGCAETMPAA
jgi:hypothetical protein